MNTARKKSSNVMRNMVGNRRWFLRILAWKLPNKNRARTITALVISVIVDAVHPGIVANPVNLQYSKEERFPRDGSVDRSYDY